MYLRTNLKIHLLEKQPEFIPVWPPVIRSEDGYIVNNREQNIYGYIVSGNDKPKVYVYNGIRKVPDELDSVNNMTCVKVWDQEALVNIDRKYISNGTLLLKRKRNIQTHDAGIYELVGDTYLSFQERDACKYCNKIVFRTENPTDFILVRSDGKIEKNGGIGDFTFEDLNNGDLICVLQSKFLVNIISVSIEEERCNTEINDDVLYQMFEKYKGTKKVRLPYKTRIQIFEMQDKVKLSRKHLVSTLKSNCISAALINVLEEILDE